jgi:hypothetical protein
MISPKLVNKIYRIKNFFSRFFSSKKCSPQPGSANRNSREYDCYMKGLPYRWIHIEIGEYI